jgi:hypothetical protein
MHQSPCLLPSLTPQRISNMRPPGDDPYERVPKSQQDAITSNDIKTLRKWLKQRRWDIDSTEFGSPVISFVSLVDWAKQKGKMDLVKILEEAEAKQEE